MNKRNITVVAVLGVAIVAILQSCRTIPKGVIAVKPFDSKRYLGKWYEIARLDFRFEKNLNNTTANYSFNDDGSIKVVNRGYNYKTAEWKQSTGKAKFAGDPGEAKLKVSFFGPFYAGYNVIALDADYKYALIAGKNLDYLWLLSREKTMPENIRQDYLQKAARLGYDTAKLVWVKQDQQNIPNLSPSHNTQSFSSSNKFPRSSDLVNIVNDPSSFFGHCSTGLSQ